MYKIGVVGDKNSIIAFKAIGVDVYPVVGEEEGRKAIDRMAANGYAIIFVTEQIAKDLGETIDRYSNKVTPAIILIPSNQGSLNIGMQRINDNVEKAVGVNIL